MADRRAFPRHSLAMAFADDRPSFFSSLFSAADNDDAERVLLSATHVWLRRIPSSLHPKRLCREHPAHANNLAGAWHDARARDRQLLALIDAARDGALVDSERVLEELLRLDQWAHRRIEVIYPALDARGRRRVVEISPV